MRVLFQKINWNIFKNGTSLNFITVAEELSFNGIPYSYLLSLWVRGKFSHIEANGDNVCYSLCGYLEKKVVYMFVGPVLQP